MPKVKIGLEIHGYLKIENKSKLFCDCKIDPEAEPNTNICPVCTSQPGSKPKLPNKEAMDKILRIALMLNCKINKRLLFQRKHYSWPDLPSGYQRTISGSYSNPVGVGGNFDGIGISDIHLEEDPAKWDPVSGGVDYNRSGFPLVEIVTEPDFISSEQVRLWLKKLITTLSYVNAIDPKAGIKSDVNVSIEPAFNRVEVKNVNSFSSIVRTIEHEIVRQEKEIKEGKEIKQHTRAYDDETQTTKFMRSKETAQDYMFIPEPDLPAIEITEEEIQTVESELPEKPSEKIEKYIKKGIPQVDAHILSSDLLLAELFEKISKHVEPVLTAKWLRRELLRVLNYNKKGMEDLNVEEKHIIDLLKLIQEKKITDATGQKIIEKLVEEDFDVLNYVKDNNLAAVSDVSELEKYCKEAIAENSNAVSDFKAGKQEALNYVVGQVMKKTRGKATPKEVNEIILRLIK
jgi:aspartyl-tRNA(Asn)/glutamyl-tRNA(Gln) amidotransferase subunit B